jgi:hypothetical protein
MRCGSTVVMRTPGSSSAIPHLWFVITEPDATTHLCGIVSLTTLRGNKDQTVTLGPSDHPYISHSSVVYYSGALIVDVRRLEALSNAGTLQEHEDCSPSVLKLIQQGVVASPFTPKKFVNFCRQAWADRNIQTGRL